MKKVLVTGAAGFIGFHFAKRVIKEGFEVIGLDNINDYYDINLKYGRLKELGIYQDKIEKNALIQSSTSSFKFIQMELGDHDDVIKFMTDQKVDYVVHLAAQAGVRYSLENPRAYTQSNVDGFMSILEGARFSKVKHLVFASSSSVYGLNSAYPFSENEIVEHPMSLYAATKRANELMAHSYAHLYNIPTTGLRFFTAYGPWGRPDMALFIFTKKILEGKTIEVYNEGQMLRDFTYVDDIVEGVYRVMLKIPEPNIAYDHSNPIASESSAPHRIFNIGNNNPVVLIDFVREIENSLGIKAKIEFKPLQPGDVVKTYADTALLQNEIGYKPDTSIRVGVQAFIDWYKAFVK
jgi:UDP-glucuronate 4-epimerase